MLVDWQIWGVADQRNRAAISAVWSCPGEDQQHSRTLVIGASSLFVRLRCAYSQDRVAAWARLLWFGAATRQRPSRVEGSYVNPVRGCQDHKLQAVSPSFLSPSLRCFISVVSRPPCLACLLANQGEVACGKDSACGLVGWFMVISGARASKPSLDTHTCQHFTGPDINVKNCQHGIHGRSSSTVAAVVSTACEWIRDPCSWVMDGSSGAPPQQQKLYVFCWVQPSLMLRLRLSRSNLLVLYPVICAWKWTVWHRGPQESTERFPPSLRVPF